MKTAKYVTGEPKRGQPGTATRGREGKKRTPMRSNEAEDKITQKQALVKRTETFSRFEMLGRGVEGV